MDMIQEHKEEKRSPLTLNKALGKDEFYAKLWNSRKKYPIFRFKESGWFWTYSVRKVREDGSVVWQIKKLVSPEKIIKVLSGRTYVLSDREMKDDSKFTDEKE